MGSKVDNLGIKDDTVIKHDVEPSDDLRALGWSPFTWLRHKNKARLLTVILILNIALFTYLIYSTFQNPYSQNSKIMLIAFTMVDTFLCVLLVQFVAKHATIPFTSLDKHKNRFTGRASLKRQLGKMKEQADDEVRKQHQLLLQYQTTKQLSQLEILTLKVQELTTENEALRKELNGKVQTNLPFMINPALNYNQNYNPSRIYNPQSIELL